MELSGEDRGERDESGGQGRFQDQRERAGPHQLCGAEGYSQGGIVGGVPSQWGSEGREEDEGWRPGEPSFLEAAKGNSDPRHEFRVQISL